MLSVYFLLFLNSFSLSSTSLLWSSLSIFITSVLKSAHLHFIQFFLWTCILFYSLGHVSLFSLFGWLPVFFFFFFLCFYVLGTFPMSLSLERVALHKRHCMEYSDSVTWVGCSRGVPCVGCVCPPIVDLPPLLLVHQWVVLILLPSLYLCPFYQSWPGFFFMSLVRGILLSYSSGGCQWWLFCNWVVILMWLWEEAISKFTYFTILTRSPYCSILSGVLTQHLFYFLLKTSSEVDTQWYMIWSDETVI